MIMVLAIFGFINMHFVDVLDILMVATIFFFILRWIRGSSAMNIFLAILLVIIVRMIVDTMNMKLMSSLLGTVIDVGVIALIVIFQPEIRHFLSRLGSRNNFNLIRRMLGIKEEKMGNEQVTEVAEACWQMGQDKTGALIVFPRKNSLNHIIQTGDIVDAKVSRRLIMNIFFKNSPLHDGAMIMGSERIVAARCTLPITARTDIPASFGMRHKAAIGITEESDADVVVVSEETGHVSFVRNGQVRKTESINELIHLLNGTSDLS